MKKGNNLILGTRILQECTPCGECTFNCSPSSVALSDIIIDDLQSKQYTFFLIGRKAALQLTMLLLIIIIL